MSAVEVTQWALRKPTTEDMYDFRVKRAHFGKPRTYIVEAKRGSGTAYCLAEFTTSGPLTDELRDACINLARCSS
jgi:hypothetical protein